MRTCTGCTKSMNKLCNFAHGQMHLADVKKLQQDCYSCEALLVRIHP
ncbi:hypothetical protein SUBVAR_06140 [Subdoligranulum variabile DSM 15176]|uniref:Uncharacterized protein n=1 Tax=Subdoligranulum variabile DSM 15176 TaxID=411471 RepID=D1PP26_9FIRM|nr:hypothetical protein SUBVAR_06140 [Subdoligranulum variabile DSM 15176]